MSTESQIPVSAITVPQGRRRLDLDWVEALADQFKTAGQQTAIEVLQEGEAYRLIFGGHRLAAAKHAGWETIRAIVKTPDEFTSEAQIRLREISENLLRRELSVLDRSVDIAAWREIYEATHGTVTKGRKAKLSQVATISGTAADDGAERFATSFSEAARRALGVNRDAISRAMKIASIPADLRGWIALHPIADNQSELLLLSAQSEERQEAICGMLTQEPPVASNVAEAIAKLDDAPPVAKDPAWMKVSTGFSKLPQRDQHAFFDLHADAIALWQKGRAP
ncbi:MAG: ParB N-terminal domain-containing protein [Rhizobiaceae bacterium]|nr:ParB N-terminal domain-containing protein [Rhizobiaceae bacterium]